MGDVNLQPGLLRQGLQLYLPQSDAVAIGPAAVRGDQQLGRGRVGGLTMKMTGAGGKDDREKTSG